MLFLDGVYVTADGGPFFRRVEPPTSVEMEKLIHRISNRLRLAIWSEPGCWCGTWKTAT
jgi:hypothetical protein